MLSLNGKAILDPHDKGRLRKVGWPEVMLNVGIQNLGYVAGFTDKAQRGRNKLVNCWIWLKSSSHLLAG